MSRKFPIMVALFASMSASCILSEPVRFEPPPNTPPAIDTSATPTARIFRTSAMDVAGDGDGSPTNALDFDVTIIDANVDQTLEYRVYLDWDPGSPSPSLSSGLVPRVASGDRTRRPLRFSLPREREPNCHWVELLVTTDFRGDTREPATPGDLATASWFVLTTESPSDEVANISRCLVQGGP